MAELDIRMTNPTHRYSTANGPFVNHNTIMWDVNLTHRVGALAVDDEHVYAGTRGGLVAVALDGTFSWQIDGEFYYRHPLVKDGRIFVPDWAGENKIHSISLRESKIKWTYEVEFPNSPAIVKNTLYSGGDDSLFALNARTGAEKWTQDISHPLTPVVDHDRVYVGTANLEMIAVDANTGETIWTALIDSIPAEGGVSPTLVDGTLYFSGHAGHGPERRLYALDADTGEIEWVVDNIGSESAAPAVVDGVVYTPSYDEFTALDADSGDLLWRYDTGSKTDSSPLVVDDTVFVGDNSGHLHAIDATDGTGEWTVSKPGRIETGPVPADDKLFFACDDHLYALSEA